MQRVPGGPLLVFVPAAAAAGGLATVVAADAIGLWWWQPLGIAALVLSAAIAVPSKRRPAEVWLAAGCVAGAAVWAAATIAFGWSMAGILVLLAAGLAAVFIALYPPRER